jgi:UDP-2-acetamido-2,6-beta-L-arabino-hexul-4-ose reductase
LRKFVVNNQVIIHTAAVNRGSDSDIIAGSVAATYNLVSAMTKFKSRAKLIFLSSIQAETETIYGLSKRLTEIMLKSFSDRHKIPVTIFRLTNVFGENCRPFYNSVAATFCYQAVNNQQFDIHRESRNKKLTLIYLGDVCRFIEKEIYSRRKTLFFFKRISSRNKITVANLAKLIESFKKLKNPKKLKLKFHRYLHRTYLSYLNGK